MDSLIVCGKKFIFPVAKVKEYRLAVTRWSPSVCRFRVYSSSNFPWPNAESNANSKSFQQTTDVLQPDVLHPWCSTPVYPSPASTPAR